MLLSATFIKGNSVSVAELNRQSFLTLDEATDIALQGIYRRNPDIQNIVIEVGQDKKTGSIKTFKGDTFWMIPLYVTETFADGKQRSNFYEVRVDVLTGEVLDIAYSLD